MNTTITVAHLAKPDFVKHDAKRLYKELMPFVKITIVEGRRILIRLHLLSFCSPHNCICAFSWTFVARSI